MKKHLVILRKFKFIKKQYSGAFNSSTSDFILKSQVNLKISLNTFKCIFYLLKKFFKKKSYYKYNLHFSKNVSFRSLGMRMGKGKGKKKKIIYLISNKCFILELQNSTFYTLKDIKLFFLVLKRKLPLYSKIIQRKSSFLKL